MGRRKLSTEERIAKQKERLLKNENSNTNIVSSERKETMKEKCYNDALKHKFDCEIIDNVVMFKFKDISKVMDFLNKNYKENRVIKNPIDGKDKEYSVIPFSYGFH